MNQNSPKSFLLLIMILFFSASNFAQNGKSLWSKTTQHKLSKTTQVFRKTQPKKANYYELDINGLKSILNNAPKKKTNRSSKIIISFPTANNTFEAFRITEASIMNPILQAKYPEIRSYAGQSIDDPSTLIRFSITPQGLHAMFLSSKNGAQFIDPFTKSDNNYIVYSKRDLPALEQSWECGVIDAIDTNEKALGNSYQLRDTGDGMLRDFRLAIATTIEYSAFHWAAAGLTAGDSVAAKKNAVMAAIVVTMTRNNFIYERDFSITMTLVANNDAIVFIDSDNFTNNNPNLLIDESQTVIDDVIGFPNYDVGHTFSTGGGGLAQLNSPCGGSKARGITGLPAPVGDAYDIDFVAHELGHQFGAPHTFNGNQGNCEPPNRSFSNAYEVGSGTTIMGYAGICLSDNVQGNSDPYFHQKSLQMIWDNVTTGNSTCANQIPTGNSGPTANAGGNFTIPISTPYKLTGSSTDADGTATHTYTWEQYDLGPAGLPSDTNTSGPMVRSFEGTDNPVRYIPRLQDVYSNGGVSTTWEKLPSVSRPQNFRLTVRDNDVNGGRTAVDNMSANTVAAAGPFRVTSQNTNQIVWTPGNTETITWDVAGTTGNGVNTPNVNILLSTDEGLTYSVITANTPNDGTHDITVPNISAPKCRIMIEGAGNIFFNVNDFFFAIGNYTYELTDVCQDFVFDFGIPVPEDASSYQGFNLNVPTSIDMSDATIAVDITHPNIGELLYGFRHPAYTGTFLIELARRQCPGSANANFIFDDAGNAVNCGSTNNGDRIIPLNALSAVDGTNAQGNWSFFIFDENVNGTVSTLNSVTITACEANLQPVLSTEDFSLENAFSIYPNPNKGSFNIKLTAPSNSIAIQVFDIRGRSVLNNSFENNSGTLNKNIDLGNVQSGIYLLNVNDGSRTITKKIIVE